MLKEPTINKNLSCPIQPTGLVDGNVSRVFSRLRMMGADITSQPVVDALWSLANTTVDSKRPGDFNQGLMELGATVCTPKAPQCGKCPVRGFCKAYAQVFANAVFVIGFEYHTHFLRKLHG